MGTKVDREAEVCSVQSAWLQFGPAEFFSFKASLHLSFYKITLYTIAAVPTRYNITIQVSFFYPLTDAPVHPPCFEKMSVHIF